MESSRYPMEVEASTTSSRSPGQPPSRVHEDTALTLTSTLRRDSAPSTSPDGNGGENYGSLASSQPTAFAQREREPAAPVGLPEASSHTLGLPSGASADAHSTPHSSKLALSHQPRRRQHLRYYHMRQHRGFHHPNDQCPYQRRRRCRSTSTGVPALEHNADSFAPQGSLCSGYCGTLSEPGFHYAFAREIGCTARPPRNLIGWAESIVLRELDEGKYLELDRGAPLVRSTISIAFSCDGKFFASTHGDHTVKVFNYPEGLQVAFLDGHPRTPWTVRFHPKDPNILATGCLGNEVRIWDHAARKCIRKHNFQASISCVSFSPDGSLLAVTSGRSLMLWEWTVPAFDFKRSGEGMAGGPRDAGATHGFGAGDARSGGGGGAGPVGTGLSARIGGSLLQGMPRELLHDEHPYHMVDFHPSGRMIMTGVKNKYGTHPDAVPGSEEQFTLKVVVHNFNRRAGVDLEHPVLQVPRVVAYNDAGIHFSPCGTMLAACIPGESIDMLFRIAVLSLVPRGPKGPVGSILFETMLDPGRTIALTNLKFSPSSRHLLAGYSFRRSNPVLRVQAENYCASVGRSQQQQQQSSSSSGVVVGGGGEGVCPPGRRRGVAASASPPRPPQINVVDLYELTGSTGGLELRRSLKADVEMTHINHGGAEDEINVAVFAPSEMGGASGVVYGTQKGRVRMFQQHEGSVVHVAAEEEEEEGEGEGREKMRSGGGGGHGWMGEETVDDDSMQSSSGMSSGSPATSNKTRRHETTFG